MVLSQRYGWIGVDVGTHTVKLAQTVRDGPNVRLHRAGSKKFHHPVVGDLDLDFEAMPRTDVARTPTRATVSPSSARTLRRLRPRVALSPLARNPVERNALDF